MNFWTYKPKSYKAKVYWGKLLISIREKELEEAKRNLLEYEAYWIRFINYCHTGR